MTINASNRAEGFRTKFNYQDGAGNKYYTDNVDGGRTGPSARRGPAQRPIRGGRQQAPPRRPPQSQSAVVQDDDASGGYEEDDQDYQSEESSWVAMAITASTSTATSSERGTE